ncbi:MAG TPA: DMT family transporter [Candidatus Dormibacteraeota bacterium]|nr:DMT family transporter [Candidatus Dormibacteraeota bacterium]
MSRDRDLLVGSLVALFAASCFGTLGPLSRFAADAGVGALGFVAWRAGLGAVVLAVAVTVARRDVGSIRRLARGGRLALALAIAMGASLNLAIFAAFGRIPIAIALVLFYTYPAMVTVVGLVLGHEPPTPARLAALALASLGVVLVLAGGIDPAEGLAIDPLGVALGLTAAVCQTVFVTISRHRYDVVPSDVATMLILGGGSFAAIGLAVATGAAADLPGPLDAPSAWPFVLIAGTLGAAVSSLLFLWAIRRIGGVRTGILMLFEPAVGTVLAAALLGQPLRAVQVAGGVLVLAAAVLVQVGPASEPSLPEDTALVA